MISVLVDFFTYEIVFLCTIAIVHVRQNIFKVNFGHSKFVIKVQM